MLADGAFVFNLFVLLSLGLGAREIDHGIHDDFLYGVYFFVFFLAIARGAVSEPDAKSAQGPILSVGGRLNDHSAIVFVDPHEIFDVLPEYRFKDHWDSALHDGGFENLEL